jgi:hypothetical protein
LPPPGEVKATRAPVDGRGRATSAICIPREMAIATKAPITIAMPA